MFIVIVLKRKSSYYVIAEKWLKRNYIMSNKRRKERRGEGKRKGSEWEGKGEEEEAVDGSGIKCKNFS